MTKYVAYYRVSTQKQGQSGLGLEAQKKAVETFTAGHTIASEYVEVESGRNNDRQALQAAIADCKAIGATLLIAKLDRLARNVAFIANLLESGVDIQAVDNPTATKFSMHILSAVAELETTMISERTKASLQSAKDRGTRLGYDNANVRDGIKAKGDASADAGLAMIQSIEGYQNMSLRSLAKVLNDYGHRTINGNHWTHRQVKRAIDRHTMA